MRDTFSCEQDIRNIARKLTKETYKKHDNDVHMWIWEDLNVLFYYQDSGLEVGGKLIGIDILFTIKI
jgi:hypothetical protein